MNILKEKINIKLYTQCYFAQVGLYKTSHEDIRKRNSRRTFSQH